MTVISATPADSPRPTAARNAVAADLTTFLKLLTTQLRHQDPMEPQAASDFAAQLATFSGVEQQVQTNTLLTGLSARMTGPPLADLAGWLGQEVRTTAPLWTDGTTPQPASFDRDARADRAVLVVRDAAGRVVAREPVAPSVDRLDWQPRDATGAPLAAGRYGLSIEHIRDGAVLTETPVARYARIEEVRLSPSGAVLVLPGGVEVAPDKVTALRGG